MGRAKKGTTVEQRFWAKVSLTDGCWEWTACRIKDEYGRFWLNGRLELAHRVAWLLTHGSWPDPQALHHCDNPPCCRPSHLFEGDPQANTDDKITKGRSVNVRGERHGRARLTADAVAILRHRHAGGVSTTCLANEMGLARSTVRDAVRGVTWSA